MNFFGYRCLSRHVISAVIAATLTVACQDNPGTQQTQEPAITDEASPAEAAQDLPAPENSRPGPVGLGVSGASAGITTDYFEQAVTDALIAGGIFPVSTIPRQPTA